jgi:hypothetical protein
MGKITSPSGREYNWSNPNPPTEADFKAISDYEAAQGISAQPNPPQGPATIAEMRRREEAGQVSALTPAQVQAQVGSPQQLEQAVQDAKDVGMGEQFLRQFGQMAEPTGQISPFVGGTEARIAPSGQFTPLGAAEARGMRRGFATGLPIAGSLLAAPFVAGMTPLAGALTEAGVGLTTAALGQTVSPEPYRAGEMFAQAIPGVPVGQQARKFTQFTKEAGSGVLTSGLQAGLETLDQDSADLSNVLFRTGLGGFLSPTLSGFARGGGALARSGFNAREWAAELQRPFTQQFIKERKEDISRQMVEQGSVGIFDRFSGDLARTLYSPNSGLNPQQFQEQIRNVVSQSMNTAGSSGLTGQDLSEAIKTELQKSIAIPDEQANRVANDVIDAFVGESEALRNRITNLRDVRNASRDARLTDVLRALEGRASVESQGFRDKIDQLQKQRESLPVESVERQRIDAQVADLNQQIASIEAGRAAGYGPAGGITKESLGLKTQQIAQEELDKFKKDREEGYAKINPDLENTKLTVTEISPTGEEVTKEYTVNQLRQKRTNILRKINFGKPVQKADYSVFEDLDQINSQLDEALASNPALKTALQQENAAYREGISRFKGFFADKILREAGEQGGMPGIVGTIAGATGPQNLRLLKNLLGTRYDEIKPDLRQFVFIQSRGENPNDFLKAITAGNSGKATGLQKEVIDELFPDISEITDVASKYSSLVNRKASLEKQSNDLKGQIDALRKDVDNNISGAQTKLDAAIKQEGDIAKAKAILKAENITSREQRIIDSLAAIEAKVRDARAKNVDVLDTIKLDDVIRNIETQSGKPLYKALEEAVVTASNARGRFNAAVKKALEPGGQLESFEPSNLIDFLVAKEGESLSYRSKQFLKAVGQSRPDLIGDAQNILVGRIIAESVDGNKINTAKIKDLVGTSEAPGKYFGITKGLFGDDGASRITKIANQLEQVSDLGKPSVFRELVLPALAGFAGYQVYGETGMTAGLGGYAAYRLFGKGISNATAAAVGRVVKTPEYLNIVSKPIDQATQAQMNRFERLWPRVIKMEQDRYQMIKEDLER